MKKVLLLCLSYNEKKIMLVYFLVNVFLLEINKFSYFIVICIFICIEDC